MLTPEAEMMTTVSLLVAALETTGRPWGHPELLALLLMANPNLSFRDALHAVDQVVLVPQGSCR